MKLYVIRHGNTDSNRLDIYNGKLLNEEDVYKRQLCGSGYQDVFWGNLIATISGATHNITKIKGSSSYNVEDYEMCIRDRYSNVINNLLITQILDNCLTFGLSFV